jgi:predicted NBD/HSP70 family sugar kinase
VAVVDEITARFARGLAALALLLDPEVVIIGGGVSQAGEQLLTRLRAEMERRVLVAPRLVLSALGEEAVALGAVRHALNTAEERLQPVRKQ